MSISEDALINQIITVLLMIFRLGAFFAASPVFGATFVTGPVRAGLAIMMALALRPLLPPLVGIDPLSLMVIPIIIQEILIGIGLAFIVQVLFQMFILAGQAIAMQAGLGFANAVDPSNGVSVPVVSQMYLMLVTLLWLTFGGHLVMIEVLVESFTIMPMGAQVPLTQSLALIPTLGSWMFAGALLMSLPAIASMLVVNLAFGVMTRSAPQLNVFALGFPLTLLCGLIALWLGLEGFLPRFEIFASEALGFARTYVGLSDG